MSKCRLTAKPAVSGSVAGLELAHEKGPRWSGLPPSRIARHAGVEADAVGRRVGVLRRGDLGNDAPSLPPLTRGRGRNSGVQGRASD